MPIPANQIRVAQIVVYGDIAAGGSSTKNTVTVLNYRRLAVAIAPSKANLDTAFQAGPATAMIAALNARWTQRRNTVRWVNDAEDAPVEFTHVNVGGVAGDAMTSNETAYLRYRTALKGRSNRGSNYFGPLSEADTTAGASDVLNAAAVARFGTLVTALGTDLVAADGNIWRLCVYSRLLSQEKVNPTNIVFNDVTAIGLNTRIGDMKRRKVSSVY